MRFTKAAIVLGFVASAALLAQTAGTPGAEYFSSTSLQETAKDLLAKAQASPSGTAGVQLSKFPGHNVTYNVRVRSGGAEMHQHFADNFFVVDGEGTEVTGGKLADMKDTGNGEPRGSSVVGGTSQVLRKGDYLHIPAGTPHQTLMEPGKTFTFFVLKVEQP